MVDRPVARFTQRIEITTETSVEGAEASQLEIRRLARRCGVEIKVLGVERGERIPEPSS